MTNNHISDDLPLLLTGDATRDVALQAATHLRTCVDCQQELVSAVVAHASLMSAHRFAPEIVSLDHDSEDVDDLVEPVALPDLSGVFAEARAEAPVTNVRRLRPRRALIGIAAAAAVIAGGATAITLHSGDTAPSSRTVGLSLFPTGNPPGAVRTIASKTPASVKIVGDSVLKIDATKLPKLDKQHLYEVWLTDSIRKNMQSVGFIGDGNTATLSVSPKWLRQYNDIEVSVQQVNQDQYSGTSVLRGSYHD